MYIAQCFSVGMAPPVIDMGAIRARMEQEATSAVWRRSAELARDHDSIVRGDC